MRVNESKSAQEAKDFGELPIGGAEGRRGFALTKVAKTYDRARELGEQLWNMEGERKRCLSENGDALADEIAKGVLKSNASYTLPDGRILTIIEERPGNFGVIITELQK